VLRRPFRSTPTRPLANLCAAACLMLTAAAAPAAQSDFAACVVRLKAEAAGAGISPAVANGVLDHVQYVDRVIELDRKQPEFTQTFGDYYRRRVTDTRVEKGREMLATHQALLARVSAAYGVPPQYLVAFWGLETNFGGYLGEMAIPDSLATLACDERRSRFFTAELVSALRIIEAGDVDADGMTGSWAGAMGHVQFMPSAFLRYAVDGDGDGRRDLWNSVPDAMYSAANFLSSLGWKPGLRWGREVVLPAGFDYSLASRKIREPLSAWSGAGVTDAFGRPLPAMPLESSVLVPAGAKGPAFVVYDNFDVIMRWNRSEFYAISVGRLADRIAGAGMLAVEPPESNLRLTRDLVMNLQQNLNALGFDSGTPDGIFGSGTREALRGFQRSRGLVPDGYPNADVIEAVTTAARPMAQSSD